MIGYILLALGVAVFVLSFLIPAKTEEEKEMEFSEDLIKEMVGKEVESAKAQLTDIVDETVTYAMEKTERSLDRLTNEKMMAVNEYSDTVLTEIDKNHQEVVFLYDMLNDKHENIKTTVSEVDKKASEVKQAVRDAELTAKETKETLEAANRQALEVKEQAQATSIQVESMAVKTESTGRTSAIDRLKNMQEQADSSASDNADSFVPFEPEKIEEVKVKGTKKRKSSKSKSKEESPFANPEDLPPIDLTKVFDNSEGKTIKDGPNLNLGTDVSGKTMGGRNNNEKILELHNMGKSNMAIAKELGLGLGEVKLVIDLFEGK